MGQARNSRVRSHPKNAIDRSGERGDANALGTDERPTVAGVLRAMIVVLNLADMSLADPLPRAVLRHLRQPGKKVNLGNRSIAQPQPLSLRGRNARGTKTRRQSMSAPSIPSGVPHQKDKPGCSSILVRKWGLWKRM